MTLTTFRQAVQTELQTDLGITMVAGIREGRSEDRDIGYVWVESIADDGADVQVRVTTVGVRVFLQWEAQQGTHRDVSAVEALMESILTSLKDKQTTLGPWFFRVPEVLPNYEDMNVTATIVARDANPYDA